MAQHGLKSITPSLRMLRWLKHPVQSWQENRARGFWGRHHDRIDQELTLKAARRNQSRVVGYLRGLLDRVPAGTTRGKVWQVRASLAIAELASKDYSAAVKTARALTQDCRTATERKVLHDVGSHLENAALNGGRGDIGMLEVAAKTIRLSEPAAALLAEAWAERGLIDSAACQVYSTYVSGLHRRNPTAAMASKPMRLLREVVSSGDEMNRLLTASRLRLLCPKLGWPSAELGLIWLERGDEDKVQPLLEEAAAAGALTVHQLLTLGRLYYKNNRFQKALEVFETAGQRGVSGTENQLRIAMMRTALTHFTLARPIVDQILAEEPDHRAALALHGNICLGCQDWPAAESSFTRVLQNDANHVGARWGLARAAEGMGHSAWACDLLEGLAAERANDPWIELAMGSVCEIQGDMGTAIDHFRRATEIDGTCQQAHARLGLALAASKSTDSEVLSHLTDGLTGDENTQELLEALARTHFDRGEYADALKTWDRMAARTDAMEEARVACVHGVAKGLVEAGDFLAALDQWEPLLNASPPYAEAVAGTVVALEALSIQHLKKPDARQALDFVGRALALDPKNKGLSLWQGLAKLMLGDPTAPVDLEAAAPEYPLATVLNALIETLESDSDEAALKEGIDGLKTDRALFETVADIVGWNTNNLIDTGTPDFTLLSSLPLKPEGWRLSLAAEAYARADFKLTLRLCSDLTDETATQLRAGCHMGLAAKKLHSSASAEALELLQKAKDTWVSIKEKSQEESDDRESGQTS